MDYSDNNQQTIDDVTHGRHCLYVTPKGHIEGGGRGTCQGGRRSRAVAKLPMGLGLGPEPPLVPVSPEGSEQGMCDWCVRGGNPHGRGKGDVSLHNSMKKINGERVTVLR